MLAAMSLTPRPRDPRLPRRLVAHQGRVKPLDTLARNTLRILSNKLEFKDNADVRQPAIRWLAD